MEGHWRSGATRSTDRKVFHAPFKGTPVNRQGTVDCHHCPADVLVLLRSLNYFSVSVSLAEISASVGQSRTLGLPSSIRPYRGAPRSLGVSALPPSEHSTGADGKHAADQTGRCGVTPEDLRRTMDLRADGVLPAVCRPPSRRPRGLPRPRRVEERGVATERQGPAPGFEARPEDPEIGAVGDAERRRGQRCRQLGPGNAHEAEAGGRQSDGDQSADAKGGHVDDGLRRTEAEGRRRKRISGRVGMIATNSAIRRASRQSFLYEKARLPSQISLRLLSHHSAVSTSKYLGNRPIGLTQRRKLSAAYHDGFGSPIG